MGLGTLPESRLHIPHHMGTSPCQATALGTVQDKGCFVSLSAVSPPVGGFPGPRLCLLHHFRDFLEEGPSPHPKGSWGQPQTLQQLWLTQPLWVAGNKWYKRHLAYRLVNWPQHLPEPAVRGAVRAAFQLWSNVSALEFWEAPAAGPADIRLAFFQGDHNDGLSNAFDGPGADTEPLSYRAGGKPPTRRGSLERRQWRVRSSFRLGQAAAPSREPSVFPPVEWEQWSLLS